MIDVAAEIERLNMLSLALVDAHLGGELALAEILRGQLEEGREAIAASVCPGGLP